MLRAQVTPWLQAEFEVIAREASVPEDKRTEYGGIEKWRLLRHLSRLDLKHFSQTVLERDSSLLYAACEMFKGEDPAAEVLCLTAQTGHICVVYDVHQRSPVHMGFTSVLYILGV